jgi:hypothetical protein
MNADDIIHRCRKHSVGVCVPQILLVGEGEFGEIIDTFYVIGSESQFVESVFVKRDIFVHTPNGL